MMKYFLCLVALLVIAGCGYTQTYEIRDVTKPEDISIKTKDWQPGYPDSISIHGEGRIEGSATISLMVNGKPYITRDLQGDVEFEISNEWYDDTAEVHYEPISVTSGRIKLTYEIVTF